MGKKVIKIFSVDEIILRKMNLKNRFYKNVCLLNLKLRICIVICLFCFSLNFRMVYMFEYSEKRLIIFMGFKWVYLIFIWFCEYWIELIFSLEERYVICVIWWLFYEIVCSLYL